MDRAYHDPPRGTLFVLSAPSGTGKTSLVETLVDAVPNLVRSRSYTSRPARPGERDGVDYNFVDATRFAEMVDANEFLEWATVFQHRYGTSAVDIERHRHAGKDVVLVIDVQGAAQVRQTGIDMVSIFVMPPSFDVLEARLRGRSETHLQEAELRRRLRTAAQEVQARETYDYLVVNDELEQCVDGLRSIVCAHRARVVVMRAQGDEIAQTFEGTESR